VAKYGKKASEKVEEAMHAFKRGKLKSSSGDKVTTREQAIAIGLSEARAAGGKVPSEPGAESRSSSTKASKKKPAKKKSGTKGSKKGKSAKKTKSKQN